MNKELIKEFKDKMSLYASKVNVLVRKHKAMKESGASITELNEIATEANSYNEKYQEVKSDYTSYVESYKRYSVLSKSDKYYEEARETFIASQVHLLIKYNIKKDNKDEEIEYTHSKPKKGSKLLALALVLATSFAAGYGLSGCTIENNNEAIVDTDNDEEVSNNEEETKEEEKIEENITPSDSIDNEEENNYEENPEEVTIIDDDEVLEPEVISTNDFAYLKESASLYDSENENKNEINTIEKYQKVLRLSTDGVYDYVQTEDLQYGYIESNKLEVLPDMYVEVDISDQTVELYKDKDVILTTLCVTGKDSTPTRIGYFPIKYKTYDTYLKGPGYRSHVYYWMPFDGGIGLHDAAWRDEFGGDIHFNSGSHGCVNMPHDAAKTIYENVSAGTKVLVHN